MILVQIFIYIKKLIEVQIRIMRDIFLEYERITKIIFHRFKHKLSTNIFHFFLIYILFFTQGTRCVSGLVCLAIICYFVFLIQYSLMSGKVQSDHFEDFFKHELTKRGHAVSYKKKNWSGKIARLIWFWHDAFPNDIFRSK